MTIRINGLDGNLFPGVWAEGETLAEAQQNLAGAIMDYVKRRPDTGPVSKWRAEYNFRFPDEKARRSMPVQTTLEQV